MDDIQVFFTTEIKNTGYWAEIGNFFLAPVRWLFSGKTIIVMGENFNQETGGIAEVPSFSYNEQLQSRPCPTLRSTVLSRGEGYELLLIVPCLLLAVIPGAILGSLIKGLSYINNPSAQKSHHFVKEMLTPKNKVIDFNKEDKSSAETDVNLYKNLEHISMSGQCIDALVISGDGRTLDDPSAREIRYIKPSKLILDGIKAEAGQFKGWDNSALERVHVGDYSGLESTYQRDPEFKKTTKTLFFHPSHKTIPQPPNTVSSIQEGLDKESWPVSVVYVVRK